MFANIITSRIILNFDFIYLEKNITWGKNGIGSCENVSELCKSVKNSENLFPDERRSFPSFKDSSSKNTTCPEPSSVVSFEKKFFP